MEAREWGPGIRMEARGWSEREWGGGGGIKVGLGGAGQGRNKEAKYRGAQVEVQGWRPGGGGLKAEV